MKRLAAAFFLLAATPAIAQEPLRERPPADAATSNLFVSPAGEPFRAGEEAPYPVDVWFLGADTNGDGRLTFAEFEADAFRFMKALDRDGDGRLNNIEVVAYEQETAPEILLPAPLTPRARQADRRSVGAMIAPRSVRKLPPELMRKGAGRYGLLNEPQPVAAADTDFNAVVTAEEWRQAARRRFQRLDADADRALTVKELPATPAQVMRQD